MIGPVSLVSQHSADGMLEMAVRTPPGCFVEVGVYKGGTAKLLYDLSERQQRRLYLFDTFTGIPYKSAVDDHEVGDFSDTSVEEVQRHCPRAIVIQGVFPGVLTDLEPVAFAHIDCDQYQSHCDSIEFLLPRMVPGGIMWFDDTTALYGARLAVMSSAVGGSVKLYKGKHYVEI